MGAGVELESLRVGLVSLVMVVRKACEALEG